jgi:signal transduction histidine kinase
MPFPPPPARPGSRTRRTSACLLLLAATFLPAIPVLFSPTAAAAQSARSDDRRPVETVEVLRRDSDGDFLPDRLGDTVRVRGVIASWPRSTGRESQLINFQDPTGGIVLYRADTTMLAGLAPGDRVDATGRLGHDDGMEEIRIDAVSRLGSGPAPIPIDVPTARLRGEELSGRLVRVSGRLEVQREGGLRLTVVDSSGSIPIYLRREYLENPEFSRRLFDARSARITGIASQSTQPPYDRGYDVVPRAPSDFDLVPPPPYRSAALMATALFLVVLTLYALVRRRRAEREARQLEALARDLEKRDAILEAVGFAARRFLEDDDVEAQLRDAMARLLAATGADGACVARGGAGEQPPEFIVAVGTPRPDTFLEQSADAGGWWTDPGVREWVRSLSRGEVVQATPIDPGIAQGVLHDLGIRAALLVPVFTGESWWGTVAFYARQAELRWSTAEVEALNAAASIIGAAIARRAAEEALHRSEEQFRQAQKMEAVGRLAGGIAHDFNNLLTAIGGHARLLADASDLNPVQREDAAEIIRTVDRASRLTRQLLAFSRSQALPSRRTDVAAVLRELQPMLQRLLGEHVRLEIEASGPAWIQIPPGQLEQVVVNLCVNARDAMPEGGRLLLHASADPVTRLVRLTVTDAGIGMDEATLGRALEPFFTTKPAGSGTGLGLSTVYGIVSKAGGSVAIESEPGVGTNVSLRFPASTTPPEAPRAPEDGRPAEAVADATVLVAEDEQAVRALAIRVLERAGYRVLAAPDGPSALQLLDTGGDDPDLLLTDVRMPGMNGHQLYREVRSRRPRVRVLYMSGYAADELPLEEVDPAHFLEKPFSPGDLLERVGAALRA